MKRKNLIAVILALVLVFGLVMTMVACGPKTPPPDNNNNNNNNNNNGDKTPKINFGTEVDALTKAADASFKTFATAQDAVYAGATVYLQVSTDEMAGLEPIDLSLELAIKACIDSKNAKNNAALIEIKDARKENGLGTVAAILFKTDSEGKEIIYLGQKVLNNSFTWRQFSQAKDAKLMSKMVTDMLFAEDFAKTNPLGYKMASKEGLVGGLIGKIKSILTLIPADLIEAKQYTSTEKKVVFPETSGKKSSVLTLQAEKIGGLASGLGGMLSGALDGLDAGVYDLIDKAVGMVLGQTLEQILGKKPAPAEVKYPTIQIAVGYNTDSKGAITSLAGLGIHYDYKNNADLPIKLDIGLKNIEVQGSAKAITPTESLGTPEEASIELSANITLRGASEPVKAELKAYAFPDIQFTLKDYVYPAEKPGYEWKYALHDGTLIAVKDTEVKAVKNTKKVGNETYTFKAEQDPKDTKKYIPVLLEKPDEEGVYNARVNDGFIQTWEPIDKVPFAQFDFSGLWGFATIKAEGGTEKVFADFKVDSTDAKNSGFKLDLTPVLDIVNPAATYANTKYFIPLDLQGMWEAQLAEMAGVMGPANAETVKIDDIIDIAFDDKGKIDFLSIIGKVLDMAFVEKLVNTVKEIATEKRTTPATALQYVLEFNSAKKEFSATADIATLMTKLIGATGKTGLVGEITSDKVNLKSYYDADGKVLATPAEKKVGEYITGADVLQSVATLINLETGKRLANDAYKLKFPNATEEEVTNARDAFFAGEETAWVLADIPAEELWTVEKVATFVTKLTGIKLTANNAYDGLDAKVGLTFGDGATLKLSIAKDNVTGLDISINFKLAGENAAAKTAYTASGFATAEGFISTIDGPEGDDTWNGLKTILFDEMMIFVGIK